MFFARFPGGGLYATGPQASGSGERIAGGPLGYELEKDAVQMAEALGGDVVELTQEYAVRFCQKTGNVLWVKSQQGHAFFRETVPTGGGAPLIRIEGAERQAALDAANQMLSNQMLNG